MKYDRTLKGVSLSRGIGPRIGPLNQTKLPFLPCTLLMAAPSKHFCIFFLLLAVSSGLVTLLPWNGGVIFG